MLRFFLALLLAASVSSAHAQIGPAPGGGSGINQLTGAVTAGPGSGSQAATIPAGQAGTINTGCQATGGTVLLPATITISTQWVLSTNSPVITTPYTINATDACNNLLLNSGASALVLPNPSTTGFGNGKSFLIDNASGGAVTWSTTASGGYTGIDGAASGTIQSGDQLAFHSDGTNFHYLKASLAAGVTASSTTTFTNKTLTSSTNSLGGVTAAFGSDAKGDIYTNGGSSNVITRLGIGSTNNCLIVASGLPSWATCPGGTITAGTTATSGFSAGNIAYSDGTNIQASAATVTSGGIITSPATGTAGAPNFVGSAAGATTGFYFPAASGQMGFTSAGTSKLDYGISLANTWTTPNTFAASSIQGNANASSLTITGAFRNASTNAAASNEIEVQEGSVALTLEVNSVNNSGGNGVSSATINGSTSLFLQGAGTNAIGINSSALVTLPAITTDAALTDTTVCQDTTAHGLHAGSGTAGICLGNVSSIRFKPDFKLISDGLSVIKNLDPGLYHYAPGISDDNGTQLRVGYTAERYAAIDDLRPFTRFDGEGKPNGTDMMASLPFAVRAIQQLSARVEDLERRVH